MNSKMIITMALITAVVVLIVNKLEPLRNLVYGQLTQIGRTGYNPLVLEWKKRHPKD